MTRPRTFEQCLADRETIRKRGGTPRPVPADLAEAQQAFATAIGTSVITADPAASLDAAVNEAVAAIVAKVLRDALADVTASGPSPTPAMNTRPEEPTMDATDYITKGGTAWQLIEARAAQRVAKTAGTMTRAERAKAVSDLLATKEGAALYSRYCEEQEQVAKRHARSRLAPPDGVQ